MGFCFSSLRFMVLIYRQAGGRWWLSARKAELSKVLLADAENFSDWVIRNGRYRSTVKWDFLTRLLFCLKVGVSLTHRFL
jgi:hypothetical protein